ncbi:CUB domain-containing protein [Caerostris extrusa]|uniref:CUB domain-containing protein n=1 Tax=Caerostris extrusa TaxID=172846 RepID=A0AAV4U7H6_CAEEX|nr:CUB domain-containing protein [Caerostris extrusa]
MGLSFRALLVVAILVLIGSPCHGQRPGIGSIFEAFRPTNAACTGDSGDKGEAASAAEIVLREEVTALECAPTDLLNVVTVIKFTCGGVTSRNETVFVNPSYPQGENGTDTCQVTVEKQPNVCQLRLDFEEFSLAQPDILGLCTKDSFMVRTTVGERLPILCGENRGQHLYIDMGRGSGNPVVLSVVSNGDRMTRKWKIKISMVECNSMDMAPPGCLQYYRSPSETVRSFNFGNTIDGRVRYLSNLRYTVCLRVEENFAPLSGKLRSPILSVGVFPKMLGHPEVLAMMTISSQLTKDPLMGMEQEKIDSAEQACWIETL